MLRKDYLSRIEIKGFKSIRQCDLQLGNINVLIGSNGAGKSNFVSAFSFLHDILNQKLQLAVGMAGVNSLLYKGSRVTDSISVAIFFENENNGYNVKLTLSDDNRLVYSDESICFNGSKMQLATGQPEARIRPAEMKVSWLSEEHGWRVYHFHDTSRSSLIKREHSIANCMTFMEDGRNLAAFLYRLKQVYPRHYSEIVKTVQLIAPYFDDFVLEPQELNNELIVLKWRQKECDDVFFASQLSDGTLRFICLATLLLQPKELQPSIIIIDEPELGLHPFALTVFSEMVHSASLNKQIIVSTQSADLLSDFAPEDIIVVNNSTNGTVFRRLNEEQLKEWLEDDYTLGDLWKKNVIGGRLSV